MHPPRPAPILGSKPVRKDGIEGIALHSSMRTPPSEAEVLEGIYKISIWWFNIADQLEENVCAKKN